VTRVGPINVIIESSACATCRGIDVGDFCLDSWV